jgi:thiamine-monophosphate kinase
MTARRPDEAGLIARYFRPLATAPGAAMLLDDAATLPHAYGCELVVTTDALIAGEHFFAEDPPDAIARKALRVNLSDLAAKAARPVGYLVTLALTDDWEPDWLDSFAEGLAIDQEEFGLSLFGGDTVRTPGPFFVSITAFGHAPEGQAPRRTGAAPGQRIYVTGTIGDAALGLKLRQDERLELAWDLRRAEKERLLDRYLLPEPRLALIEAVATYAAASMDVSDGLVGDAEKLAGASKVALAIDAARVPLSDAARRAVESDPSAFAIAVTGGDDYELLLTVDPDDAEGFEAEAAAVSVAVTDIGVVIEGEGVTIERLGRAVPLGRTSFSHF